MTIIDSANELVFKLFGKQELKNNCDYRFSAFCEKIKKDNGYLIYNNLTKELLLLTESEYIILLDSGCKKPIVLVKELISKYFLVPLDHDDIKVASQVREVARNLNKGDGIEYYTILPTTGCNARCFYCFEAGVPIHSMTPKTASDVAYYILNKKPINKRITIRWFGGEPLCNVTAIDIICKILKKNNVDFISTIVTNAYLFDEELINRAIREWNLKSAQITLDGYDKTYNKVKNYKNNDSNAFLRVTDNIENLCSNGVSITIRLNMDGYNFDELLYLVDWIAKRYEKYKNLAVYSRPLFEDIDINKVERNSMERKSITKKFINLQEKIKKVGLFRFKGLDGGIKVYCCQADSDTAILISPEGKLGRCEHHVNDDFLGTIYDDSKYGSWNEYCEITEECRSCIAYPTCMRLKGCNSGRNECYEYEKYMRIETIRNGMEISYKKYLKEQNNDL